MMVAANHAYLMINTAGWQAKHTAWLLNLFNGRAAVILFFVLSGLVLGLSIRRADRNPFARAFVEFELCRFFRIYPAFLLVTALSIGYLVCFPPGNATASDWMTRYFSGEITPRMALFNLLFQGTELNRVAWTLRIEVFYSLALPFFHLISKRLSAPGKGMLVIGLAGLAVWPRNSVVNWAVMFYLGYLLPEVGPCFLAFVNRKRLLSPWVALGSIGLWLLGPNLPGAHLYQAAGAASLLALVFFEPALKPLQVLDSQLVKFYGRISYSFYLLHLNVMFVLAMLLVRWIPPDRLTALPLLWNSVLFIVSVAVVTPLAWMLYRFIERPFINFSKKFRSSQFVIPASLGPSRQTAISAAV